MTEACKRAVASGKDLYLKEISDSNSDFRENALDLIISLEKYAVEVVPTLKEIKSKETNYEFKAMIEEAIAEIGD